jgi:hypothetical protein
MIEQTEKTIEDYFKTISNKYSTLSLSDVENICKAPFYYIRKCMEQNDFPTIHIKYLGKFLVYKGKAKQMLQYITESFNKGEISKVDFDKSASNLKKYLEND